MGRSGASRRLDLGVEKQSTDRSRARNERTIALDTGDRIEILEGALREIEQWSRAYPLSVFPEPDLHRCAMVLAKEGLSIDTISAHAMRHVLDGVAKIVREALGKAGTQ